MKHWLFQSFFLLVYQATMAQDTLQSLRLQVLDQSMLLQPVQGGTFYMGSNEGMEEEKLVHKVELSGFFMMDSETTWALWEALMGQRFKKSPLKYKPKKLNPIVLPKGPEYPVSLVTYQEVLVFIEKLNALTGKKFRLPTEAEWEYAARGGAQNDSTAFAGSADVNQVAWVKENSLGMPHKVKTKQCNSLKLYDLSGNVSEWCLDYADTNTDGNYYERSPQKDPLGPETGDFRIVRGGSWADEAWVAQVFSRSYHLPDNKNLLDVGFRLVLPFSTLQ